MNWQSYVKFFYSENNDMLGNVQRKKPDFLGKLFKVSTKDCVMNMRLRCC